MTTWIRKPAPYDVSKSPKENRFRDRGAVRCPSCGAKVDLELDDTNCEHCGQLFNAFGQALVDPRLWEEPYEEN